MSLPPFVRRSAKGSIDRPKKCSGRHEARLRREGITPVFPTVLIFDHTGNGTNTLNSGPQLLYFRRNKVGGKFLAAKAKLRASVIQVAKVRPNLPSYELPKRFCPYFVQRRPRVR